jgi:hypothetical protein
VDELLGATGAPPARRRPRAPPPVCNRGRPVCPPLTLCAAAALPYELLQHLLPQATDLAGAEGALGEGVGMERRLGELHRAPLARIARPGARARQRHSPSRAPAVERCLCWRWRRLNRCRPSERRLPIWGAE